MNDYTPSVESLIQHFLERSDYRPLKQHELARAMKIAGSARSEFRHALYRMEREGKVVRLRKNRWSLPDTRRHLTGELRVNAQGFGFVTPETPGVGDVFIPEEKIGASLDGDRVMISIESALPKGGKTPGPLAARSKVSGQILRVLERRRKSLVGLLKKTLYYWYVIPDYPGIRPTVQVREFSVESWTPEESVKVVILLDSWDSASKPLTGVVTEILGAPDQPGVDMLCILRDHELETDFSKHSLSEAAHTPTIPDEAETRNRKDLRDRITFTIDPEEAHDFDDAVSLTRDDQGRPVLGVHIADVAHYVAKGSSIVDEACHRGNTVYLVDRAITMLPPYLTKEVCSLQAGKDRLTHTVEVTLDKDGQALRTTTFPSVIRSSARLTYEQVQALFEDRNDHGIPSEAAAVIGEMRGLARLLRRKRMARGAIDLNLPEVRIVLDAKGHPVGVRKRGCAEAYNLIEEFMLMANCAVAGILSEREIPTMYRIHDAPDEEQWSRMGSDLAALGIAENPENRHDLNAVAHQVARTPMEYSVNLAILKNLKRALYSPTLKEHFGLAAPCYTHFTSPIRRYPDLVIHRLLNSVETREKTPYSNDDIARIAEHCSRTEKNADEAEEESVQLKRVEYYAQKIEDGDTGPFEGLVVSIVQKGLIVELLDTLQRGMIPFSSFTDDYYVANPERTKATGRRRRAMWTIGQRLEILLDKVDQRRHLVDFLLYRKETGAAPAKRKPRKKKR